MMLDNLHWGKLLLIHLLSLSPGMALIEYTLHQYFCSVRCHSIWIKTLSSVKYSNSFFTVLG